MLPSGRNAGLGFRLGNLMMFSSTAAVRSMRNTENHIAASSAALSFSEGSRLSYERVNHMVAVISVCTRGVP